jgi:hypothetical protein
LADSRSLSADLSGLARHGLGAPAESRQSRHPGRRLQPALGRARRATELLCGTPGTENIIERFRAVGATRPVELTDEQKALIVSVVDTARGASEALHELRHAFIDELKRVAA